MFASLPLCVRVKSAGTLVKPLLGRVIVGEGCGFFESELEWEDGGERKLWKVSEF